MILDYDIVDVDYWEKDAILLVGLRRYYFQFIEAPTIQEALDFLEREGKHYDKIRNDNS